MFNPASWCRENDVRPGKGWQAKVRVHWTDGRDPWEVRVTAIGESAILVRRPGAGEFCLSGAFVERLEWLRPGEGSRTIEVGGALVRLPVKP